MNKRLRRYALILMLSGITGAFAFAFAHQDRLKAFAIAAQEKSKESKDKSSFGCRDNFDNDRLANHCEIKEQTLAASGSTITVDGRQNGGIRV